MTIFEGLRAFPWIFDPVRPVRNDGLVAGAMTIIKRLRCLGQAGE
jgi:hypothetical protein